MQIIEGSLNYLKISMLFRTSKEIKEKMAPLIKRRKKKERNHEPKTSRNKIRTENFNNLAVIVI